jgi:hypothetical protein
MMTSSTAQMLDRPIKSSLEESLDYHLNQIDKEEDQSPKKGSVVLGLNRTKSS